MRFRFVSCFLSVLLYSSGRAIHAPPNPPAAPFSNVPQQKYSTRSRYHTVILPILIFGSSFSSDLHLFLKQLVPVRFVCMRVVWRT